VLPIATRSIAYELGRNYEDVLRRCDELQAKCHTGKAGADDLVALFEITDRLPSPVGDDDKLTYLAALPDQMLLKDMLDQLSIAVLAGGMERLASLELRAMTKAAADGTG
jgi:hypothetical protein